MTEMCLDVVYIRRFLGLIDYGKHGECWHWKGTINNTGYGQMLMGFNGKRKAKKAHRITYELFVGDIPDEMWVLHHCDNPVCCNPHHLYVGTRKDNIDDMVRRKRRIGVCAGEANWNSKLTTADVVSIRKSNKSDIVLAEEFSVSKQHINKIRNRVAWNSVEAAVKALEKEQS